MPVLRSIMDGPSSAPTPFVPRPGEVVAGKYRIEETIGFGGMGVVVRAIHEHLGHPVALKVVAAHASEAPDATQRLLREARAAASLQSEHVVRILDVDLGVDGTPYIVMELLSGCNLQQLVEREGPLPVELVVDYLLQACHGVAAAHEAGIVHRDLKPSNLFLTRRRDGAAVIKVLDFGVSKFVGQDTADGSLTDTRAVLGSPRYMSPEQVRSAKLVDERTDVWALGTILHELLTGSPAFAGDTMPSICASIVTDEPESVRKLRPEIPGTVEAIVRRCLQKDRNLRYSSVEALMQELRIVRSELVGPESRASAPTLRSPPERYADCINERRRSSSVPDTHSIDRQASNPLGTTLVSGRPETESTRRSRSLDHGDSLGASHRPVAGTRVGASRRPRTYVVPVAILIFASFAAAMFVLRSGGESRSEPTVPASGLAPSTFSLHLDSRPSGAEVSEGSKHLGTTPLKLELSNERLEHQPRAFSVRLPGFRPEVLRQGPENKDLRVVLSLVPLPATPSRPGNKAAPQAATATAERPSSAKSAGSVTKSHATPLAPPVPEAQPSAPTPDSDLRSER